MVFSTDGGPVEPDCTCPVCVDLQRRGVPIVVAGLDGKLAPLPPQQPPPMLEATVRGTLSTWPELAPEPRSVLVPVGTVVMDLLEYLRYQDHGLQRGFPPGGLAASIDGRPCDEMRVVRQGDELRVSGDRAAFWDAVDFAPMPEA